MTAENVSTYSVATWQTPCRVTFRDRGRSIRVTMASPAIKPNELPLSAPIIWPVFPVDRPTLVSGFITPATFSVDGLGVPVDFTTRLAIGPDGALGVEIDSVQVTPTFPTTDLALPLIGLLRAAIRASGVRGIRVPPQERWTWDVWNDLASYSPADDTAPHYVTQDGPSDCWLIHVGPLTAAEELRLGVWAITGTRRARRTELTDDVLQQVAEVYRSNPRRTAVEVAAAFGIGKAAAGKRIRAARDRGFLEDTAHNDKRRNQGHESTRNS